MGYRPSCSQKEGKKKAYFWVFQCIFHCLLPTKAWQRNQVGNQTADQWNRERWAKRTQRTSPKYERWRPQTATGDKSEQQLHVWCLLNASLSLRHESFCAQQASLTVQRSGSGCPAALFIQFGGGAREGGAAAREPAPYQCVLPLHILRRRCLGPKVKTIPSCTSLPAHFCTVTFTLLFWLVFFSFLFFSVVELWYLGAFSYIPWDSEPPFSGRDGCSGGLKSCLCACVTFFMSSAPPQPPCVSCLCRPAADNPKRLRKMPWCIQTSARALRCRFDPKPQTECKSVHQGMRKLCILNSLWRCKSLCVVYYVIISDPLSSIVWYAYVYICLYTKVHTCRRICLSGLWCIFIDIL